MRIVSDRLALSFAANGRINELELFGRKVALDEGEGGFLLNGTGAAVSDSVVGSNSLSGRLVSSEGDGVFSIEARYKIRVSIQGRGARSLQKIGLTLFLPEDAVFHLPAAYNIGRQVDGRMPVGETFSLKKLAYQFVVIRLGPADVGPTTPERADSGSWLGLSSPIKYRSDVNAMEARQGQAEVEIHRLRKGFSLRYEWCPEVLLLLDAYHSLEEAALDFHQWLKKAHGLVEFDKNSHIPDWIRNTRLILPLGMLSSDRRIVHNYQHAIDLCHGLNALGCPEDTLFHISGWNSYFDSGYPEYDPAELLGGKTKFKEFVDTAHEYGYRVAVHANPWGADPHHPDFPSIRHLALEQSYLDDWGEVDPAKALWGTFHKRANLLMWPGGRIVHDLGFDSGGVELHLTSHGGSVRFRTVALPDRCEAYVTFGGISATNVTIAINGRYQSVSPSFSEGQEVHSAPLTFFFQKGENDVELTFDGRIERGWYRIYGAQQFSPNWTWPIVRMDMRRPEWIELFTTNISRTVREYSIDAVHLDCTVMWRSDRIYMDLRDRLPGVAFNAECPSHAGLGFFSFSLGGGLFLEEEGDWKGRYSELPNMITRHYTRFFTLRQIQSFVPARKPFISSSLPKSVDTETVKRALDRAESLHLIRAVRVNYRDHGLDAGTAELIRDLAGADDASATQHR
jgi:hypothetical protein